MNENKKIAEEMFKESKLNRKQRRTMRSLVKKGLDKLSEPQLLQLERLGNLETKLAPKPVEKKPETETLKPEDFPQS